ncbi:hypothetical protein FOA52_000043 [Chlamydomonas sp. UWO 241]|nr:hypothetical protein FOA52_000043 [Chlamydomonas sp. UWO 241]
MSDFPRDIEQIAEDYAARRSGLLKALTDDVEEFFKRCDPERDNLCLYGHKDGSWSVDLPVEDVPPELPEPCLGVNFARDGMSKRDWLALVAVHSDAWLMAVAYFYAVKLDAAGRSRLHKLLNAHPTLFEVVTNRRSKSGAGAPAAKRPKFNAMGRPTESATPSGTPLREADLGSGLRNRAAELFWPDDAMWYLVEVQSFNPKTRQAKILYASAWCPSETPHALPPGQGWETVGLSH